MFLIRALGILAMLCGRVHADPWEQDRKYGNGFFMEYLPMGTWITAANYSITPPPLPCNAAKSYEELVLWIGLQNNPGVGSTQNENFVQPTVLWGTDGAVPGCTSGGKYWCASTSTYTPVPDQVSAGFKPIAAGERLDIEIIVGSWVKQTIYINGTVFQTQTDSPGMKPGIFESQSECIDNSCGTLQPYSWANLTVVLNKAHPTWGASLRLLNATSTGWKTADGGVTWTNEAITMGVDYMYKDDSVHQCNSTY